MPRLTIKQKIFIQEYIKCGTAAEAARRSGYSLRTAPAIGHELMKKPHVRNEIERMVAEKAMATDEVLARLADLARADIGRWMDKKGNINVAQMKKDNATHLINSIKTTRKTGTHRDGTEWETVITNVTLYNSQEALKTLLQYLSLGASGKEDDPLHVQHNVVKGYMVVTPDDWDDEPKQITADLDLQAISLADTSLEG
jgi:phage terminase small subunit